MSKKTISDLITEFESEHRDKGGDLYASELMEIIQYTYEHHNRDNAGKNLLYKAIIYAWESGYAAGYRSGQRE